MKMNKQWQIWILFWTSLLFISSVKADDVAVLIYDSEDYSGKSLQIRGDTADLKEMDDKMVSFQITPGYTVRFYENKNFTGGYYSATSSTDDVTLARKITNKISSIKVLKYDSAAPVIATLYSEPSYSGDSFEVRGDIGVLTDYFNHNIKSYELASGYQIRFFDKESFQGGYYSRNSGHRDSADSSAYKKILSLQILKGPSGYIPNTAGIAKGPQGGGDDPAVNDTGYTQGKLAATIYDGDNKTGTSLQITRDMPNLSNMDDKASSFVINSGFTVRFYIHPNYNGKYIDRTSSDTQNMGNYSNWASSIKVVKWPGGSVPELQNGNPVAVTIWPNNDYYGSKFEVTENISSLASVGLDNSMSSFQVTSGYQVRFFQDNNYRGNYWTREANATDDANAGGNSGFNDKISSIQIIKKPSTSSNNSGSGSESGFDADGRAILPSNIVAAKIYSRSAILSIKRHQPDLVVHLGDNAQELMIYPCFELRFYQGEDYSGKHWDVSSLLREVVPFTPSFFSNGVKSVEIIGIPVDEDDLPDGVDMLNGSKTHGCTMGQFK